MKKLIPQHLSKTNEHGTPGFVIEIARHVLERIDLDPASSMRFNCNVRADRFFELPDDGLAHDWNGCVFLNPPGGRTPERWRNVYQTQSNATAWWRKLTEEYRSKRTRAAIFVGFTLELLRSAQCSPESKHWPHPFDFTLCVPRERLCFGGDQPTHANVIVYLGTKNLKFVREFSSIGRCL